MNHYDQDGPSMDQSSHSTSNVNQESIPHYLTLVIQMSRDPVSSQNFTGYSLLESAEKMD